MRERNPKRWIPRAVSLDVVLYGYTPPRTKPSIRVEHRPESWGRTGLHRMMQASTHVFAGPLHFCIVWR